MSEVKRGVAICHYNRTHYLGKVIQAVKDTTPEGTMIVVCDDGSDGLPDPGTNHLDTCTYVEQITQQHEVVLIKGPNLGVAANKNRALWALRDCHYLCILEDDLLPKKKGWFETYEKATRLSGCHHFCRVQDKEVPELAPAFEDFMVQHGCSPVYGPSPRGDLTFITRDVVRRIGAFNPRFRGAGYAHGEWSTRVYDAGLIGHPGRWMDIKESRDKIYQIGDREGGRWEIDSSVIKKQIQSNKRVLKELKLKPYVFHPLVLE
jgi:glycosyltransferase involved in cell wall biosynthesis